MKNALLLNAMNDLSPDLVRAAEPGRKRAVLPAVLPLAAAVLICGAVLLPFALSGREGTPAARVYLDVNPGFSLAVSKSGKILSVSPENEDAKRVLAESASLAAGEVTVPALLGGVMESGFLSEEKYVVLLSVECGDEALSEKLKADLASDARAFLEEKIPDGRVISQTLGENRRAEEIARKYGISTGAAAFLVRLIGVREDYTEKALSRFDLTTLCRLCEENGISVEHRVLITEEEALEIAYGAMKGEAPENRLYFEHNDDRPSCSFYCYVDNGDYGAWRVAEQCEKSAALYDINAETGKIERERHTPFLDRLSILDEAIRGAGFTPDQIAHYKILKSETWNWEYVQFPSETGKLIPSFSQAFDQVDLDDVLPCFVELHPAGGPFLRVRVSGTTGNTLSVERRNTAYRIDTLDAVVLAMEDAGIPAGEPPFPDECLMTEGLCTLRFHVGEKAYHYEFNALTGEILSRRVTPYAG